jgi:hypothetical protein
LEKMRLEDEQQELRANNAGIERAVKSRAS